MGFNWYHICDSEDNSLEQGDFIPSCPIVIPPKDFSEDDEVEIEIQEIDSIILSQSCDLDHGKITNVLVCPYLPLKEWLKQRPQDEQSKKSFKSAVKHLKQGHFPGYHLLNKESQCLNGYQVVDFKNVYGVNYEFLSDYVEKLEDRVRLLSPYKEHLSQAFARYFMRVGLPQDLRIEPQEYWPFDAGRDS